MNDTTITPEERALWASVATARINAVTPERLCEITAQERLVKALKALEQAEASAEKAERRNGYFMSRLMEAGRSVTTDDDEFYPERIPDLVNAAIEQGQSDVARLTKMVDWLANQLDCPSEFTNCAVDCAECRKEAARRAVDAGEG